MWRACKHLEYCWIAFCLMIKRDHFKQKLFRGSFRQLWKNSYKNFFKAQNPCFDKIIIFCQVLAFLRNTQCIVTECSFSTTLWTREGCCYLSTNKRKKVLQILKCTSFRCHVYVHVSDVSLTCQNRCSVTLSLSLSL